MWMLDKDSLPKPPSRPLQRASLFTKTLALLFLSRYTSFLISDINVPETMRLWASLRALVSISNQLQGQYNSLNRRIIRSTFISTIVLNTQQIGNASSWCTLKVCSRCGQFEAVLRKCHGKTSCLYSSHNLIVKLWKKSSKLSRY